MTGETIVEDAPRALRFGFIKRILEPVTFIDGDSRYRNKEGRPLGVKALGEELFAVCCEDPPKSLDDSWHCQEEVRSLLFACPWYHFFDCVEHIGRRLQRVQPDPLCTDPEAWRELFGFDTYRASANDLLTGHSVVWRLNAESRLEREMPEPFAKAIETVEEALAGGFEPASVAFHKARGFLTSRPLDPENAIKEIVSSVESVGRSIYPGTANLPDVCKEMRRAGFPPLMVSVIEKFYGFASAEPGVRHGGATTPKVELADADFCLIVGTALIRYLIDWPAAAGPTTAR